MLDIDSDRYILRKGDQSSSLEQKRFTYQIYHLTDIFQKKALQLTTDPLFNLFLQPLRHLHVNDDSKVTLQSKNTIQ